MLYARSRAAACRSGDNGNPPSIRPSAGLQGPVAMPCHCALLEGDSHAGPPAAVILTSATPTVSSLMHPRWRCGPLRLVPDASEFATAEVPASAGEAYRGAPGARAGPPIQPVPEGPAPIPRGCQKLTVCSVPPSASDLPISGSSAHTWRSLRRGKPQRTRPSARRSGSRSRRSGVQLLHNPFGVQS